MAGADEAPVLWGLQPTWQPLGLREGAALQGCREWSRVAAAEAPPLVALTTLPSPNPRPGVARMLIGQRPKGQRLEVLTDWP